MEEKRKIAVDYFSVMMWIMASLLLVYITYLAGMNLLEAYQEKNFGLEKHGIFFLNLELLLMTLKAVREGGHFPRRDLPVFLATVLVFGLAIEKSTMTPVLIITIIISIVILLLLAQVLRVTNNIYNLKH